ncbi:decaprenylphospho-beta-D-erythro-pentofuranosid-2-ulose 2-reductase [Spongiactinospora rosea]|uniref:Decaprenylphospho-beta-D-erythro-pentofuranosid-2-ulose 2-reductase n=1 Tax=Spongiactinospora rosea TaxID=2248750 RepID=A0A366LST1_9ACTN|nr:SDR family NAD(P)-dependent oxidoreductase [Spongiactinospora rosea]RBQ16996.1 decaprenylphospho-beta-D-erythro-pentofuranosid-2-ulose 2-reductase [Spongiactinospora rosea]
MKNSLGGVDTVLLLGGRSEIGLAVVARLVRGGARRVVLALRDAANAVPPDLPAEVHLLEFDAARPETHPEVIEAAAGLVGDLDVVIGAFGVLGRQDGYDADPAAAAADVMVNFAGHVSTGLSAARRLREQGHGTLVVLSSVAGVRVRRANFVYGSAKAGLDGFAQGLRDSLHGTGVRVLLVRPGFVRGRMTAGMSPAPLSSTPGQVADAVVAALRSGHDSTVWVPRLLGPAFTVLSLLPRAAWRRLPR